MGAKKATKTVLTVDDDSSVRMLIRAALKNLKSVRVIEAEDGLAGLQAIEEHHPDLVILDVVMPRLDGINTLQKLRSDPGYADIPVILLTGVKDKAKLLPLLQNQSTEFLPKPFIIELLRQKVSSLLYPESHT